MSRVARCVASIASVVGVAGDVAGVAGHCGALPQVMHGVASHLQAVFVAVSRQSVQDYLSVSDFPYIKHLYLQPQKKVSPSPPSTSLSLRSASSL